MSQTLMYIFVVGIGSTIALDLWATFAARIGWLPGTHWPSVGRWLLGIPKGKLVIDGTDSTPHSFIESAAGWVFHYLVGIGYAISFPLFWGIGFISAPTIFPFFLIGVVISSLAGLMILMPGMGGGLFARKTPSPAAIWIYVVVAHIVFAVAEYALALLFK
ncbi:DUF2938 family protein [Oceanobacter mangrovi]|uniref:DUF2938 family protein n=1 Tax=Oceanobacter mangrovi TaxID=2862510 RepID=UPI001C8EA56C|nr:DUF2938 family protein [Oceanobacter mangrovi]